MDFAYFIFFTSLHKVV